MNQYTKINTIFKRDMTKNGQIMEGIYSEPEIEYLKDNIWIFTEKVDGTNIRVIWNGESVVFGGKTDNAQMPTFLFYKLQELFEGTIKKQIFVETFNTPEEEKPQVCLYGEGYGAKIQTGGKYIKDGVDFILFDIKIGNIWLKRNSIEDIAQKFGIKVVPIIGEGTLSQAIEIIKKGFNSQWGDFIAEGIVLRPKVELLSRMGYRVITKIKYKDFR